MAGEAQCLTIVSIKRGAPILDLDNMVSDQPFRLHAAVLALPASPFLDVIGPQPMLLVLVGRVCNLLAGLNRTPVNRFHSTISRLHGLPEPFDDAPSAKTNAQGEEKNL